MNFKSLMNPFLICFCYYPGDCMWQNSNENFFFPFTLFKTEERYDYAKKLTAVISDLYKVRMTFTS